MKEPVEPEYKDEAEGTIHGDEIASAEAPSRDQQGSSKSGPASEPELIMVDEDGVETHLGLPDHYPEAELKAEVEKLRRENEELHQRFLRARADMENSKRRLEREKQDLIKFANRNIIVRLLDVVDNFERAMETSHDPADSFVIGVNMIHKQLLDVLKQEGVEEVEAHGKMFDPYLHEALAQESTNDHKEHTILEVFQKGFKYRGQLLRAAKVKVATPIEQDEVQANSGEEESSSV